MYDLIIVGGGMSGISVAHHFREHNILLLEKGDLLQEASGKNAGFIISGFGEHFQSTARRWGLDRAREIQDIHLSNHRRIRKLAGDMDCNYRQQGSYAVALDEKEKAELARSSEMMQSCGYEVKWIETPELGLKHTKGAIWNPADASIDAASFWDALAQGIPTVTDCKVKASFDEAGSIRVDTTKGEFHSGHIVFCVNAFASHLVPELQGLFIPVRGQMLELPVAGDPPTECPSFTDHGDVYWRFSGRSLLFGGLEALYPELEIGIAKNPSQQVLKTQLEWIRRHFDDSLFPERIRRSLCPTRTWCSTMAFTVDGFPFVGELRRKNHYVLSGLCGLGHSYALECAYWLYEKIIHSRDAIPSYFSSDRIEGLPVASGGNWRSIYEAWNHRIH